MKLDTAGAPRQESIHSETQPPLDNSDNNTEYYATRTTFQETVLKQSLFIASWSIHPNFTPLTAVMMSGRWNHLFGYISA